MSIIKVKFFARIREEVGRAEDQLDFRHGLKVSDVWNWASGDDEMPEAMLVAVNMEHVKGDPELKEGDEVAFFPPVTGG
ncbi:MAG: MoaD/ThiS family protein [Gammaproteobacteria bacterium]|nr:MoaD/ThiS family protein [Gammaproteobacteria bacterium]